MKAVILSAAPADHASMTRLAGVLRCELGRADYSDLRWFDLTTMKLAFCMGEFDCWVKSPGCCSSHDGEADIHRAIHDADALVLLGPATFGGHGYVLKRAVDRTIGLIAPFFTTRASLTHHVPRYERFPSLFAIGWARDPSVDAAATYAELNDANAINFLSPTCCGLILDDAHVDEWAIAIRGMLARPRTPGATITAREPLRRALLAAAEPGAQSAGSVRIVRSAILVGSAKPRGTSASETLARALAARLSKAGVNPKLHFATEFVHDDPRAAASARSIAACDLFVLATPLYVDSLPALATHALELIDRARAEARAPARFALVINCGFPEAEHNRTAIRIAHHFADHAGYAWGGALPIGGGGVITPGRALDEDHGPIAHVVRALDLAGPALAGGYGLPAEAIVAAAEAPLSDALYRLIGDVGWRWEAYRNGLTQRSLRDRPLDTPDPRA